jgi:glutathione synthase/RimK-type ligase-like ATP-grasp enzyme
MIGIPTNTRHALVSKVHGELMKRNIPASFIDAEEVTVSFRRGKRAVPNWETVSVVWLDRVVEKGNYLHTQLRILRLLELQGFRFFNKPGPYEMAYDKAATTTMLVSAGLLVVDTLVTPDLEAAVSFLKEHVVCISKPPLGFLGHGSRVLLASDLDASTRHFRSVLNEEGGLYIQRYIVPETDYRDLKLYMVGDKVADACFWLPTTGEKLRIGDHTDKAEAVAAPETCTAMAREAMRISGLDFAGVDFLYDAKHG